MMREREEVMFLLHSLNRAMEQMILAGDDFALKVTKVQINTVNWMLGADNETQSFLLEEAPKAEAEYSCPR